MIDALVRAVGDLRKGVGALKAENAELRSERRRMHRDDEEVAAARTPARGSRVEEQISLGVNAPATARRVVAAALAERVPAAVIERAKLTISELVTNSVCHSGTCLGAHAVVRVELRDGCLRLEVEDPGQGGAVVRRTGGGFGLQVVETLSERWGSERRAGGSLRVWAELSLAAPRTDEAPAPSVDAPRPPVHVVPESRTHFSPVRGPVGSPATEDRDSAQRPRTTIVDSNVQSSGFPP